MDVNDPVQAEAIADEFKELLANAYAAREKDLTTFLQDQAYEASTYQSIPAVTVTLPKHMIQRISQRNDVSQVYLTGKPLRPTLDSATPTVRAPVVWARGITGNGVQIAIVEDGKVEDHQWINVVATRPLSLGNTDHATWSAGVAASSHGTFKGIAPGAEILSAPTYGTTDDVVGAIDWAKLQGADVVNSSYSVDSSDDDMHELDRVYDYFVRYSWLSMPVAAGNMTAGNHIGTPGKAYNVITIGGFDDHNDSDWSNDSMEASSAFQNPKRDDGYYGDREKPEVVAVGADVTVLGLNGNWYGTWGTSVATPQASGLAALLMQRQDSLRYWPEAVKAIMMAAALHNIDGSSIIRVDGVDDKDGAGGIAADFADQIAMTRGQQSSKCSSPCWWAESVSNSEFPVGSYRYYQFDVPADALVRVAVTWDSAPASNYATDPLQTNLNLLIFAPDGQPLDAAGGYSASWDNNYEIAELMLYKPGTYKIGVYKSGAIETRNNLGIAWTYLLMPYRVNLPLILKEYQ